MVGRGMKGSKRWWRSGVDRRPQAWVQLSTAMMISSGMASGLVVSRVLGPAGRGLWAGVTSWLALIAWMATLGVDEALPTLGAGSPRAYSAVADRVFRASALPGSILAGVVIWEVFGPSLAVCLTGSLYVVGYLLVRWSLAWGLTSQRYGVWAVSRAVLPSCQAVIVVTAAALGYLTAGTAVALFGISALLAGVLVAVPTLRARRAQQGTRAVVDAGRVVRFGLSLQLFSLPATLNWRLDQLLMTFLVPRAELGSYAVAATVASIPIAFVAAEAERALPGMAVAAGDEAALKAAVAGLARRLALLYVVLATAIALSAPVAIPALFGPAFGGAAAQAEVLLVGMAAMTASYWATAVLRTARASRLLVVTECSGLLVAVVLLVLLLPPLGAWGAVVASVGAYIVKAATQVAFVGWAIRSVAGGRDQSTTAVRTDSPTSTHSSAP